MGVTTQTTASCFALQPNHAVRPCACLLGPRASRAGRRAGSKAGPLRVGGMQAAAAAEEAAAEEELLLGSEVMRPSPLLLFAEAVRVAPLADAVRWSIPD